MWICGGFAAGAAILTVMAGLVGCNRDPEPTSRQGTQSHKGPGATSTHVVHKHTCGASCTTCSAGVAILITVAILIIMVVITVVMGSTADQCSEAHINSAEDQAQEID